MERNYHISLLQPSGLWEVQEFVQARSHHEAAVAYARRFYDDAEDVTAVRTSGSPDDWGRFRAWYWHRATRCWKELGADFFVW